MRDSLDRIARFGGYGDELNVDVVGRLRGGVGVERGGGGAGDGEQRECEQGALRGAAPYPPPPPSRRGRSARLFGRLPGQLFGRRG